VATQKVVESLGFAAFYLTVLSVSAAYGLMQVNYLGIFLERLSKKAKRNQYGLYPHRNMNPEPSK
jgi:2-methylisocitrate lyase-like PEP mutase family enzyme